MPKHRQTSPLAAQMLKYTARARGGGGARQAGGSISIACDTVILLTAATPDAIYGPLRIDGPGFVVEYVNQTTSYPSISPLLLFNITIRRSISLFVDPSMI